MKKLGTFCIVMGTLVVTWAVLVWQWQDPFSALYTRYEQHLLARQYAALVKRYHPHVDTSIKTAHLTLQAVEQEAIAASAQQYRSESKVGHAIGRIRIGRLHLNMVLVDGTDHESLKRGPGRDLQSFMPGQGQLVYVAGHRTTYLAPFAHIDSIKPGDKITIQVPYGTFVYRAVWHRIVTANDISVLRSHNHEVLILQACHPRFFATHRYLVYAVPIRVEPVGMKAYNLHVKASRA